MVPLNLRLNSNWLSVVPVLLISEINCGKSAGGASMMFTLSTDCLTNELMLNPVLAAFFFIDSYSLGVSLIRSWTVLLFFLFAILKSPYCVFDFCPVYEQATRLYIHPLKLVRGESPETPEKARMRCESWLQRFVTWLLSLI